MRWSITLAQVALLIAAVGCGDQKAEPPANSAPMPKSPNVFTSPRLEDGKQSGVDHRSPTANPKP